MGTGRLLLDEVAGRTVTGRVSQDDAAAPPVVQVMDDTDTLIAEAPAVPAPTPEGPGWAFTLTIDERVEESVLVGLCLRGQPESVQHIRIEGVAKGLAGTLPPHPTRDRLLAPHFDPVPYAWEVTDPAARVQLLYEATLTWFQLFDPAFYVERYGPGMPDGADPLRDYLVRGAALGHWPNAFFSPQEYLALNPDVAATGIDPAVHYQLFGFAEGRPVGALFNPTAYLESNPDVAAAGLNPLYHFMAFGRHEGRSPTARRASALAGWTAEGAAHVPDPAAAQTRGRLLFVTHDLEVGGAQELIRALAQWMRRATRFDVAFVALKDGAHRALFEAIAPTFIVSGVPEEEAGAALRDFAGEQVVGMFVNSIASAPVFAHWSADTPAIAYVHELPRVIEMFPGSVEVLAARSSRILTGSGAVRDNLIRGHGLSEGQVEVLYDFIGALPDTGARAEMRTALGLQDGETAIMGCGVMHWRKAPETFIEVAARVIAAARQPCRFFWIGDGPDFERCAEMIAERGLAAQVTLLGYRNDVAQLLQAADLFLLPSLEDAFPLVCLYAAAAEAPVICFEEAGGMPEFVAMGAGRAVPFGDVDAMAEAALAYLDAPDRRARDGAQGRALVGARFTVDTAGPRILSHLRTAMNLPPEVSVIVPNYNYATYLPERLGSIAAQSFQDVEVILLDDASTDTSADILRAWAAERPDVRLDLRSDNSGSPFVQWLRGMELARSDLIWIAEADDFCDPDLLDALVTAAADRNVFLAHAASVPVDADGAVAGDYATLYLDRIAPGRWQSSYAATDHAEVAAGFAAANVIPNASAVLFRRFTPEPAFVQAVTEMRMCGDWFFYLRALKGGRIGYDARPLNFHRRHTTTVTHKMEGSDAYFAELATARRFIGETWAVPEPARTQAIDFTRSDLDRFGITDPARRAQIEAAAVIAGPKRLPSVLVVVSDLSPGGGQLFGLRLANGWMARGGRTVVLNAGRFQDDPRVRANLDPRVALLDARAPDFSLRGVIESFDINVVHSSLWWADRLIYDHRQDLPADLPWVVTTHGCYETLLAHPDTDAEFPQRMAGLLQRVDQWVYTADKNLEVFARFGQPGHLTKLANGFRPAAPPEVAEPTVPWRDGALRLVLASRALADKGWAVAVAAVAELNAQGIAADLALAGEGPAAAEVAAAAPPHVHLLGQMANLSPLIARADLGLLPTWFEGESMPLVILEFLAQGRPVIASDHGEIAAMLRQDGAVAGAVLPLQDGRIAPPQIVTAVKALADPTSRMAAGVTAREIFDARFHMDRMLDAYGSLYTAATDRRRQG